MTGDVLRESVGRRMVGLGQLDLRGPVVLRDIGPPLFVPHGKRAATPGAATRVMPGRPVLVAVAVEAASSTNHGVQSVIVAVMTVAKMVGIGMEPVGGLATVAR